MASAPAAPPVVIAPIVLPAELPELISEPVATTAPPVADAPPWSSGAATTPPSATNTTTAPAPETGDEAIDGQSIVEPAGPTTTVSVALPTTGSSTDVSVIAGTTMLIFGVAFLVLRRGRPTVASME